jgi:hypothetical protein
MIVTSLKFQTRAGFLCRPLAIIRKRWAKELAIA